MFRLRQCKIYLDILVCISQICEQFLIYSIQSKSSILLAKIHDKKRTFHQYFFHQSKLTVLRDIHTSQ